MKTTRSTKAKEAIQELIEESQIALSHADIQESLNDLCNRVTIYRVLDRLVDENKIHKILDPNGVARFSSCIVCDEEHEHQHHHLHFSCRKCREVRCLHHVVPSFQLPSNYIVEDMNLTVEGICDQCNA